MSGRRWFLCVLVLMATLLPACGDGPALLPQESSRVEKLEEYSARSDMSRVSTFPVTFTGTGTIDRYIWFGSESQKCSREVEATLTARADHTCELMLRSSAIVLVADGPGYACGTKDEFEVWTMQGTFDPTIQYCVFTTCNGTTNFKAEGRMGFGAKGTKDTRDLTCTVVEGGEKWAEFEVRSMAVVK